MRKLVLMHFITILLFPCFALQAQFSTPEIVLPAASTNHFSDLQAADLNNDGLNDLIGKADNVLAFYENLGDGEFENALSIIEAPVDIQQFVLLDSDNDGDVDIWISSTTHSRLYINENNTFTQFQSFTTGGIIVKGFDINNDGWQDIIAATANSLRIYLNNGTGEYVLQATNSLVGETRDLAFTDINDDGFTDIVYQYWTEIDFQFVPGTGYLLNDGNHNFPVEDELISAPPIGPRTVKVVDFDLDGDDDILLLFSHMYDDGGGCPFSESQLILLEKNDSGGYNQIDLGIQTRPYFRQLHIMDINNDGYPDVIANFSYTAEFSEQCLSYREGVQLMINNGDNTATNQLLSDNSNFGQCLPFSGVHSLIADISGNELEEIIFSERNVNFGHESPSYFSNNGTLSQGLDSWHFVIPDSYTSGLYAADINGDGTAELVQWSSENLDHNLMIFYRNAANDYEQTSENLITTLSCNNGPAVVSMITGDLDGNGMQDVIYARRNGPSNFELIALINDGNGIWSETSVTLSNNSLKVYTADLDNDEKDEIIVVNIISHQIKVFKYTPVQDV